MDLTKLREFGIKTPIKIGNLANILYLYRWYFIPNSRN